MDASQNPLSVGDSIVTSNAAWTFAGDTAKNFDGHVSKSVPCYAEGHELIAQISDFFVGGHSVCYELGCSTGTLTRALARRHGVNVKWIGLDIEPDMIEQARESTASEAHPLPNVSFITDDINLHPYEKSDFIVAYYTLQFVRPRLRQELLARIYESLNWGGAFLLFEKVRAPDARFQDIAVGLYNEYKLKQGYDAEQILQKTRSLKGVLEPFSTDGNMDLLRRAGFVDIVTVFKHICFEGFLCIK
ncbi:methyltransferase domain-containing protein [Paraherbaspirillum soli]|uniref:Methyltransferase domain-containing protein n=1 Tax=Paraherbaspirillum soli TaxID=631222 RepID=A0ABW0M8G8_9BURK